MSSSEDKMPKDHLKGKLVWTGIGSSMSSLTGPSTCRSIHDGRSLGANAELLDPWSSADSLKILAVFSTSESAGNCSQFRVEHADLQAHISKMLNCNDNMLTLVRHHVIGFQLHSLSWARPHSCGSWTSAPTCSWAPQLFTCFPAARWALRCVPEQVEVCMYVCVCVRDRAAFVQS